MILESLNYENEQQSFLTLTYSEENLPYSQPGESGESHPTLDKSDLQKFLKRLRKNMGKFRYFACGEYGTKTHRPHYHLIIFGLPLSLDFEERIRQIWGKGHITVAPVNPDRFAYVAGYTLKKLTTQKAMDENDRTGTPEFATQSRRPGLGSDYIEHICKRIKTRGISVEKAAGNVDVAAIQLQQLQVFRFNGKTYPLDRFAKDRIAKSFDLDLETSHLLQHQKVLDYDLSIDDQQLQELASEKNALQKFKKYLNRQQI